LADRLLRAADRGVRVRLLIDDNYLTEARDFRIAALDAHPKIEVRWSAVHGRRGYHPEDRGHYALSTVADLVKMREKLGSLPSGSQYGITVLRGGKVCWT
jgi:phosphatidylserine/phosphatidylglycerophosphate/cardiolipin synthase-like enzyme